MIRIRFLYNMLALYILFSIKKIDLASHLSVVIPTQKNNRSKNVMKCILTNRLAKLQLEMIIFKAFKLNTTINIKNVFTLFSVSYNLSIPKKAILWRNSRLFFFYDFINLLFFSIFFRKSSILAIFLSKNITNKKTHFNFLNKIRRLLSSFFYYGRPCNLVGLVLRVHGKFQGRLRKRKFKYIYGRTNRTSFSTFVDYDLQKSYTKWGVFSIKVLFFYAQKTIKELREEHEISQVRAAKKLRLQNRQRLWR